MTTKRYTDGVKQNGWPGFFGKLWQRSYHDRIVRDDDELNRIRQYIINNPSKWASRRCRKQDDGYSADITKNANPGSASESASASARTTPRGCPENISRPKIHNSTENDCGLNPINYMVTANCLNSTGQARGAIRTEESLPSIEEIEAELEGLNL